MAALDQIWQSPFFSDLLHSPWTKLFGLVVVICSATRIVTGLRTTLSQSTSEARDAGIVPYWIPWLGSSLSFVRFQYFLAEVAQTTTDTVFALKLGGTKHNFVTSPSCSKQVLNQRSTIDGRELTYYVLERFFGDRGTVRKLDPELVYNDVHRVLFQLMREPFVSNAIAATVRGIEERTPSLISFSKSWVDQSVWERPANVKVIPGDFPSAEASFYPLVRNFVGDLATTALMGHCFTKNYPEILEDMWTWDKKFNMYLLGLPNFLPGMAAPSAARERIRKAVQAHQEALLAIEDGQDPGSQWDDMSDCSQVMCDRATIWRKIGAGTIARSAGDAAVLWAMNANANPVIFWVLWHIFSQPSLLAEVRSEIDRYVRIISPKSDLPVAELDRLSMDIDGLRNSCPLLKATYFETMRVDVQATSYKSVLSDFTIKESEEDAAISGKGASQAQAYTLRKGEFVCIPHSVHQNDKRYFPNPEIFDPKRFLVKDEKDPQKVIADMGTMNPFGGGTSMCKGRTFAEREVLAFAAGILATWDFEPLDGTWKHPGTRMASGTVSPVKDVRVRISRRKT